MVLFLVDDRGRAGEPALYRSSGFDRLDAAALVHLQRCIDLHGRNPAEPLPAGRYLLPMVWRLE